MMGLTPIAGTNDDGAVFSTSNASALESFAASNGVAELSFWEVDGYDKGTGYQYSSIFNKITGGGGTTPPPSGSTGPITGYQGLCLDDRSASTANFNPIQVYTCNGTNAQSWTVESQRHPAGPRQVPGRHRRRHGQRHPGATCTPATAPARSPGCTSPTASCVNPNSGKCLDDTGFGGSGTQVQIWACADSANQQWNVP